MNRKAQQDAAQVAAVIEGAKEQGRHYYHKAPGLMLVAVGREGAQRFGDSPRTIAFLQGYVEARTQHEEFLAESER